MSKIWDALQKAEEGREVRGAAPNLPLRTQLTAKQRTAIEALLATDSLDEAVRISGAKEATLRRWMTQASFVSAYFAAGRHQLRDSLHRLRAASGAAVEVLRKALEDPDAEVRIRAAAAILQAAALRDPLDVVAPPAMAANAQHTKRT